MISKVTSKSKKSWLKSIALLAVVGMLVSGCGGKKSKSEQAAKSAAPVEDITTPPQVVAPKAASEDES